MQCLWNMISQLLGNVFYYCFKLKKNKTIRVYIFTGNIYERLQFSGLLQLNEECSCITATQRERWT